MLDQLLYCTPPSLVPPPPPPLRAVVHSIIPAELAISFGTRMSDTGWVFHNTCNYIEI